jgi:acetyl-CoA carboxylase carboxyl transferase subunit beta
VSKKYVTVSIDRVRTRPEEPRRPTADRACPRCESHYRAEEMRRNMRVCTACGHHFPVGARERLDQLAGNSGWRELWPELRASDPLQFYDMEPYPERARRAEVSSGLGEAVVAAELRIDGQACVAAVMDFAFMGGSMGAVVGEKIARACERAIDRGLPLVIITASGGARMQEGVLALMQMAKTVVAFESLADAGLPVVVVLGHPTTGGVWASFAALGDVTYAEPGALIAFSGPRVIEQTTREKLPPEFGLAESQLANGQIDAVVDRRELALRIGRVLRILDRPLPEPGPPLAVVWAQEGADRAARAAQALPGISRRWLQRVLSDEDGGPARRLLARLRGEIPPR